MNGFVQHALEELLLYYEEKCYKDNEAEKARMEKNHGSFSSVGLFRRICFSYFLRSQPFSQRMVPVKPRLNQGLLRAILASLALLGLTLNSRAGLLYGSLGFWVLLASTLIFLACRRVLPKRAHRIAFFLLLLFFGVIGTELSSLSPLLLVSVCVLASPDLFRPGKKGGRIVHKTLSTSFLFWMILSGHGILTEFLGQKIALPFFQLPCGSYFLAGLILAFLPKSPREGK